VGFSRGETPSGEANLLEDETFWSVEATRWLGRGERATGHAGEQITGYYRFTRSRIYEQDPGPFPNPFFPIEVDIALLGARYVRDRFDSPFDPTRGYGIVVDGGFSEGYLGSDIPYWTALANGTMARGVFGSSTWVQSLRLGIAESLDDQDLIEQVSFFAGGQGSIRGFDRNSVGPVRIGFEDWEPAGGGALVVLNEELRIPVWSELRAAVFVDVGQVWESWGSVNGDLAVGAGVGVRWATPVGPLWADVAWPVVNPDVRPPPELSFLYPVRPMSSSSPKFYIGIGRPF
jgi:outer membrane translocation and assembly module TamA